MIEQFGQYIKEPRKKENKMHKLNPNISTHAKLILVLTLFLIVITSSLQAVIALPAAPQVTLVTNTTMSNNPGTLVNTSGGSITTMVLNATSQNLRWKAYVGNVTGKLTLDDSSDYTVFDWTTTEIVGEVYATRSESSINWGNINCSTQSNITTEEIAIDHTSNPNDNISATFAQKNHSDFYVGNVQIETNSCYSIHTYVNDTSQYSSFEEILLHDDSSMIYATAIETDALGFNPDFTYDFQMILPESGLSSWTSSTAYYFYVELI